MREPLRFLRDSLWRGLLLLWSLAGAVIIVVGGSLVAGARALADAPWSVVVASVVIALLLAALAGAYSLWRAQRDAAAALEPSPLRDQLGQVYGEGSELKQRAISSDDELEAWIADLHDWNQRTAALLQRSSPGRAQRFANPGQIMAGSVTGSYNRDHNDRQLLLLKRLEYIAELHDRLD